MNPYHILGVSKNYSLEELKEKYKNLAMKVHPDKGGTEELFLLVTKCYKYLVQEFHKNVSQKEYHDLKKEFKQDIKKNDYSYSKEDYSASKFDLDKFNKVFTDTKLENAYDKGYSNWMSDEPFKEVSESERKVKRSFNLDKFNDKFEKMTDDKNNKFLVKYKEPEPLMASKKIQFTELGEENIDDFSADNVSKKNLNFMDYKVAHTTQKIVDPRIAEKIKQYKNLQELEKDRSSISYEMEEDIMESVQTRMALEKEMERRRTEAIKKQDRMINENYSRINMLLGRR